MSWFGGPPAETRATKIEGLHPRDPALVSFFGGEQSLAGVSVTPETALGVTALYAGVRILAETLAMLPLPVYRRLPGGNRERDREHPLDEILNLRPNRWQTAVEFKEMLMGHLVLRGNAYAEIISTDSRLVTELIPLHPDRVMPFWAPDGLPAYRYQPRDGGERILLASEMFHLRGLSGDGLIGYSPIQLHREAIGLAIASERHGAAIMGNDATPRGFLKTDHVLTDEALKTLRLRVESRHKGPERSGNFGVLEGGMDWKQIGLSAEDAQWIEGRRFQVIEMARILRLPPHLLASLDRATYTNIQHQQIEFVTYSMMPWLVRWQQAIARHLLTDASRRTHFAEFMVNALLRGDTLSRYKAYAIARQWGFASANDVLRKENENAIGEQGDVYLSPMNMTPAQLLDQLIQDKIDDAMGGDPPGGGAPRAPEPGTRMNGGYHA